MEGYLNKISNRTYKDCYSKMRISNHRFAIETGRFRKNQRDERWCLFCKHQSNAVIEDENIYSYIVLRMTYIETILR